MKTALISQMAAAVTERMATCLMNRDNKIAKKNVQVCTNYKVIFQLALNYSNYSGRLEKHAGISHQVNLSG